ncbi:hypothetical protein [Rariglobus hedericola]|uniref:Uncharacterized protein n=2 Tax=Rariglobus hedericola TaxID=2597822 RepID=A0A556QQR8_9BACT|nr:hypothetical protein [Rariglobus hedericola]TSJ78969.1 hypothetical protein FPL22_06615 [Rariglobus hedericola]
MEINWLLFLPALLLVFYPLDNWLHGHHVRLRDYERLREDRLDAPDAWWRQPWFWVDPLRAFAGSWLLRNAWVIEPPLPGLWRHLPLLATVVVLALAVGVQMHTRRDDGVLFAPVGYTAGIVFGLMPPEVAILVVVLAGACLMAFRGWGAFFFCGSAAAGIFGYLILKVDVWMAATVLLLIEPLLLSLLVRRQLRLPISRGELVVRKLGTS